jgi:Uma2 family endonuclease
MSTMVAAPEIEYPSSDGKPMAENTKQFHWIALIKGNLEWLFKRNADVFVAGDHLIYPVEKRPDIRQAPDVYVAFGRPKKDRGSYRVFEEEGVFPQVVFEVLSPGNRSGEMALKSIFYDRYGAEEYYVYDPDTNELAGLIRRGATLVDAGPMDGFVSPRLGICFDLSDGELQIFHPNGRLFRPLEDFADLAVENEVERKISDAARGRAEKERDAIATERDAIATERDAIATERDAAKAEAAMLRARLAAAGLLPQ